MKIAAATATLFATASAFGPFGQKAAAPKAALKVRERECIRL